MNLPNKITLSRIILLPVFLAVGLIAFPGNYFVAAGLFILLAVTDFLDGYLARKNNIVTNLGKFLDPIADKLLYTTGLLLMIVGSNPIIPNPFGIICVFLILLRDYAVTGLRQIAQLKGVIIAADKLGKIKANFQYVMTVWGFVVGGLLAIESIADTLFVDIMKYVFYALVGFTTLIVVISGIMYLVKNGSVFAEEKKEETKKEEPAKVEATEEKVEEKETKKAAPAKKSATAKKAPAKKTTSAAKKNTTKKTTSKKA